MNNRRFSRFYFLVAIFFLLSLTTVNTFAQTDPEDTAVPYPITTPIPTVNSGYPANEQPVPPTLTPDNPTPYPVFTNTPPPTIMNIPVVGNDSDTTLPRATIMPAPAPGSSELIQSRLVMWLGFLIGLFIFVTGIYGAIILYTRK